MLKDKWLLQELERVCRERGINMVHNIAEMDGDIYYDPIRAIAIIGDHIAAQALVVFKNTVIKTD